MSCYQPMYARVVGITSEGKKQLCFLSRRDIIDGKNKADDVIPIPCGRCDGCRLDYSREWANRCMLELEYHEKACFITLTYDDLHVPIVQRGHAGSVCSLFRRDVQLFIKRLRKAHPGVVIRYFGCGEYGEKTLRPHYHLVLFGIDFSDLVSIRQSQTGHVMFQSDELNRLWSFPPRRGFLQGVSYLPVSSNAGIATVQPVTWETCCYTARYCTKKLYGKSASFYKKVGIEPPFCMMSRMPGLGRQYYEDHPECVQEEFIYLSTPNGGLKFRPPGYFLDLYEQTNPIEAQELKAVRAAMACQAVENLEKMSGVSNDEYLMRKEEIDSARINTLKRTGV